MLNLIHYRKTVFLSCMLGTLHFFLSSLTLIVVSIGWEGPRIFWFQNNTPIEDSTIFSTILSPIVTIFMLTCIVKHFAFFGPLRFFFSTQKGTVSCVCVRGGGGW